MVAGSSKKETTVALILAAWAARLFAIVALYPGHMKVKHPTTRLAKDLLVAAS
jgi:hypothetical protein